jgi:transposase-like protein
MYETLEAGVDYPRLYREFVEWFPDDEACLTYLEELRWPNGFTCPACHILSKPWRQTRGRLVCSSCHHQTSVTSGTIFEKTRTPLTIWLETAWHMTTAKNGLSAKTVQRTLGTGYRTAWKMLHQYRIAMVRSERKSLSGIVEIDEALVGGVEHGGKRGRGTNKAMVVIAIELKEPKGFGRVRMRHIPDASGEALIPFICDTVRHGSVVQTDGWNGYNQVQKKGYLHHPTILSSISDSAHISMPGVHRIASLLKRWILGTHQGSVSTQHLQSYLEEFTFRFNRRTSLSRGLVFRRLLEQAVVTEPMVRDKIAHGYDW